MFPLFTCSEVYVNAESFGIFNAKLNSVDLSKFQYFRSSVGMSIYETAWPVTNHHFILILIQISSLLKSLLLNVFYYRNCMFFVTKK